MNKPPLQYEHHSEPLLSLPDFLGRVSKHGGIAILVISISLGFGMLGYRSFADLSWVDSFLNASMILTGMGPVNHLDTNVAKLFAGFYALYSGIAFLTAAGILFAPILHRIMHKFHMKPS